MIKYKGRPRLLEGVCNFHLSLSHSDWVILEKMSRDNGGVSKAELVRRLIRTVEPANPTIKDAEGVPSESTEALKFQIKILEEKVAAFEEAERIRTDRGW